METKSWDNSYQINGLSKSIMDFSPISTKIINTLLLLSQYLISRSLNQRIESKKGRMKN
jgi:hypothetical protein